MAVNYRTTLKTTRMEAVRDDIDSGAGPATLEICSAAFAVVLITFTLDDPASSVATDTLTLLGVPLTANATASGTATVARIKEFGGAVIVNNLTVGVGGTDIVISNTGIINAATYSLTAGTIVHSA